MKENMTKRKHVSEIIFLILFIASLAAVYMFSERMAGKLTESTLRSSTETSHEEMVLVASNSIELEIKNLFDLRKEGESNPDWSAFLKHPDYLVFDQKIHDLFHRTNVLKFKVYANDGTVIFSTDPTQVGEDYSE